jgi:tetratricopeptide (TPR) repeat protein/DNA-binding XRE family transcriptional regulator
MVVDRQESFGSLVRRYRRDAELTQEALAERAGLSVRAVRELETGRQHHPRQDTVRLLLAALSVPAEEQSAFLQAAVGLGHKAPASAMATGDDGSNAGAGRQKLPSGGFAGSLPVGAMVGREAELHQMLAAVQGVVQGEGRLILLAGEPGIGKTRLAQELTVALRDRGFLVAAGRCTEADETVPYHPFVEALTTLYQLTPPDLEATVSQEWPQLATLVPGVHLQGADRAGTDDQRLLLYAVTRFLEAMTALAPLALVLDDLHWADASSLKLLLHLAHHTRTLPVLLLGSYRDVEVGRQHPLEAALRDLQRAELAERIAVRRLDLQETSALAETTLGESGMSAALTKALYARTEGNPFFLQQVVRSLVEQGEINRHAGQWTRTGSKEPEVPESIRSVIGHRLSRLAAETQEVLHQASVLGQTFAFDDLQALRDRSEEELDAALVEAGRAGLVVEGERGEYALDHALTQQTLYGELSARKKRMLHRAAGQVLEGLPERQRQVRVAELAWHFLRGDDPEKALTYSLLAGDAAAAAVGYAEAEAHFRTAEELAGDLEDARSVVGAQEKRGGVLGAVGQIEEAITVLEQAADSYLTLGDAESEARVVAELGIHQFMHGTADAGIDRVREMLAVLHRTGPSETLVKLSIGEAGYYFSKLRFADALASAERALEAARRTTDPRLLSQALVWSAPCLRAMGHPKEAIRLLQEAATMTDATGDVLYAMWTAEILGQAYLLSGELELATPEFERALAVARRLEHEGETAHARSNVALALFYRGRWEEAERAYRQALDFVLRAGVSWGTLNTLTNFGLSSVAAGRWEEADQLLTEALTLTDQCDDLQWRYLVLDALAELDLLRGHPQHALRRLEPIRQHPGGDPGAEFPWTMLGWTLLDLGRIDEAAAVAHRGLHPTNGSLQRLYVPVWLELSGTVTGAQEQWEDASRELEEGLREARSMGMPYYEGRIRYRLGLVHARRGEPDEARTQLETALAIFRRLGALPFGERTERALAELEATVAP